LLESFYNQFLQKSTNFRACYNWRMPYRVVFMGSPDFSVPSLRALVRRGESETRPYHVVGVVTQPDRPGGRGGKLAPPAVKEAALELGLALIQPGKLRETDAMEQLRAWQPDVIVVVAFGQILRPEVLSLPQFGCVNVHGSLLPRWRGAAPIQAAILGGDEETGITIMKMDPGIDTGPLLSQRATPIQPDDTAGTLFEKLSTLGADLLLETLPAYLARQIQPQPQPEEGATYARMLKKEDGRLDWALPARELARRVRAFNPWPGAFFDWQGGPLRVLGAHAAEARAEPGQHLVYEKLPAFGTGEGRLVLDEVQPPGKKPMAGRAFLAGARGWSDHE
jgi:methionyl-tRNA formyltransferase